MSEQHARHEDEAGRHRAGSDAAPPHRYTAPLADALERRWQQAWDDAGIFRVANPGEPGFDASRPKFYVLDMFPYPSGSGLHVGHPEGYTATDILARFKRMQGFNVLHPMGWDAFGLPAEQYAVETNVHPATTTRKAIDTFRRQLKRFGFSYDWSREVSTIDPGYYKWTQWIWLRGYNSWCDPRAHAPGAASKGRARPIETLLEDLANERLLVGPSGELVDAAAAAPLGALSGGARGGGAAGGVYREWAELSDDERHAVVDAQRLAYLGEQTVNWCPALGTVLANEEVIDGRSERGGHPVKRVALRQWMFRITAFAERLLEDLAHVDWPESTRTQQTDWIGRSEGAEIDFALDSGSPIRVFTTRPDTLFGATYVVLAPEHPLINDIVSGAQRHAVAEYLQKVASRSDIERQEGKEKTGVFTGAFARNPATGEPVPVWVADYVLPGYGTGAIMAVPAHDERDFEFARAFGLPIRDAVHTAPLAALRAFAARYDPARLQGMDAIGLAADFVGLCVSHSRSDYDAVWEDVQRQRTRCELGEGERRPGVIDASQLLSGAATAEGLLGVAGRDRRGSVAFVWREALHDLFGEDVEPLISAARDGRLVDLLNSPVSEPGVGANSSNAGVSLDGLHTADAKARIVGWLEREGHGERKVTYKLRDWLFSRQRYWGEPFPVVYDELGRAHALPESDLPVELPSIDDFRPVISDTPSPPLGRAKDWVSVTRGGKTYRRETNTMPNWAGSCWYYLRYCDPANKARFVSPEAERYWMGPSDSNPHGGVDLYMGGAEHAVLHLLYARFWHKMLYDLGEVTTPEPFRRLRHQGLILSFAYQRANATLVPSDQVADAGEGRFVESATGERVTQVVAKMSKSLKNVVNPDDVIAEFGADTFRLYEMAMGPIEASKPWNPRDIVGPHRFLQRLWRLVVDEETGALRARADHPPDPKVERALHRVIKKVGHDVEALSFNTAIAAMIEFVNEATGPGVTPAQANRFVRVIAPFAPHIAEELWSRLGHTGFVSSEPWPAYDEAALAESEVEIAVQVNGKVRGKITVPAGADDRALEAAALADPKAAEWTQGKPARKVIVVKGRLVNIVV